MRRLAGFAHIAVDGDVRCEGSVAQILYEGGDVVGLIST
jgi:hypothetical protein